VLGGIKTLTAVGPADGAEADGVLAHRDPLGLGEFVCQAGGGR
jgi:hypothetical protein